MNILHETESPWNFYLIFSFQNAESDDLVVVNYCRLVSVD